MIDFRYHIVSIVAIFLALAVGIVLGSGPLKDDISGFLEARTAQLAREKVDLQREVAGLRSERESAQTYAELVQPSVVDGLLVAQPVALVLLPGASRDAADAVSAAVEEAGGRITERVEIQDRWIDPEQVDALGLLAAGLVRGGATTNPYELAGQALAGALVTDNVRLIGQPYTPSVGILAAFADEGFLKTDQDPLTRAGSAIVIGSDKTVEDSTSALTPLLAALAADGQGEVVAAPLGSAQPGGIVAAVRDSDLSAEVSTVDRVETAQGVSVTVLALVDDRNGVVGHYGTGPDSDGPAPDPIPGN